MPLAECHLVTTPAEFVTETRGEAWLQTPNAMLQPRSLCVSCKDISQGERGQRTVQAKHSPQSSQLKGKQQSEKSENSEKLNKL